MNPVGPDLWPRTSRLLPWSIAAFLAMLFLFPFDSTTVTGAKPDRPLLIIIAALWLLSLALIEGRRRPRLNGTVLHAALLFFVVMAILSVLLNADTLRLNGELGLGIKKLIVLIFFVSLFAIVASALRPREARNFIPLVVGLGCVAALGAVWEYRTGFNPFYEWGGKFFPGGLDLPSVATEKDATGRIPVLGPTIHPLAAAQLIAMVVPFAIVGGMYAETKQRKVFYFLGTLILLAGVFATQRKTGPLVLAAGILTLVAYKPREMLRMAPAGVALLLAVPLIAPSALGSVRDQLKPGAATSTLSTRDRTSDYEAIGPEVLNHPAIGRGWQTYDPERYRVLDNEYLSILVGNGWLGVGAFVLVLIAGFAVCTRAIRTDDPARAPPALATAGAVAMMAVASATFDTIAFAVVPYTLCFFLGLAAACAPPRPDGLARVAARLRLAPSPVPRSGS